MNHYRDVLEFHVKFELFADDQPVMLDDPTALFRIMFMHEELHEFMRAHAKDDLPKALDALIDLVYVAYGTAIMMGISPKCWAEAWDEVQRANLSKERATSADQSQRSSTLDVVKPKGWLGPDIVGVLVKHKARL